MTTAQDCAIFIFSVTYVIRLLIKKILLGSNVTVKKSKLELNIINFVILFGLIFSQIMVPAFGFACNDVISVAANNDQNCVVAEKSCCTDVQLPIQDPASQENKKHYPTSPCCDNTCDTCLFFCCNSTASMLTSFLPKAHCSLTSSILLSSSVSYTSPYYHGIYRPPRT